MTSVTERTSQLADELAAEADALDREVAEIDLLVSQARTESGRHETRRAAAAEKLAKFPDTGTTKDAVELADQIATLTRRSALMDAQLEILEGKQKSLARLQEAIRADAERVRALAGGGAAGTGAAGDAPDAEETTLPPAASRLILNAQEDLRREIARAMHDGPAQSLTNIVLQAQIVQRLLDKDPGVATTELHQLVEMVQQTLEATKTFIFDVRPMVLDDLGLVPTLRRAARERGRRSALAVEFESVGVDRRLPVELESGLFRIVDEALGAYLAARPDRVSLRLDWGDSLVVEMRAERAAEEVAPLNIPEAGKALPPALAAMVEERRTQHGEAVEAAERAAAVRLPARLQRDLEHRAESIGVTAEVLEDGSALRLTTPIPGAAAAKNEADGAAD